MVRVHELSEEKRGSVGGTRILGVEEEPNRGLTDGRSQAPRLPKNPPRRRIIFEEVSIIILLGIIPSFVWAHFNASPGYIETGWPGLILGGVILGLLSGLFWRPKQQTWWAEGSKMFPRR